MMEMMKRMMSPSQPAAPNASGGASQPPAMGTGGMGSGAMAGAGCCGGAGPKPFYATLMTMPTLTPEARRFIETEANSRIGSGSEQITTGQNQLHQAMMAADTAAVQRASASVRRGLLLVESGASALQAVNEGQSPPKIALAWFKGQANLPATELPGMAEGPWGLSWFHLTTMTFLVVFLTTVVLIHFSRMRRVAGLVERLNGTGPDAFSPPAKPLKPTVGGAAVPALATAMQDKPSNAAIPPPAETPQKQWSGELRVANIFQETPLVKTFRFMAPDYGPVPFTFLPGQFLTFSGEIGGKRIRRSYTIASSPTQRDYVEITVKREEQGLESRFLHDNVAVGDLLSVSGPSGMFTFTGKETESIVLIAGGVGITPMMCIIRYLTDRAYRGDIFFLYGARTAEDFIFHEELGYLEKRHPNLHVIVTMSHAKETSWQGAHGPVSKEFMARAVPEIARRRVHLCGPPPMMEFVKTALAELGVPKERIKTEAFGPALGAAPATAPQPIPVTAAPTATSPSAQLAAVSERPATPIAPAARAAPSAQAQVEFSRSAKSGILAPDQTVLEAAEAIGVAIDYSCRVGTCGTCMVPLTSGTVTMEVEDGLPLDQKAKGMILACQAKSVGNLVVDA